MKLVGAIVVGLALIAAVIFGAVKVSGNLSDGGRVSSKCSSGQQTPHEMIIKNNSFSPAFISAAKCDTLTIKNLDDRNRLIAFGTHEKHLAYDGITERYLLKGEELKITLYQTGRFLVHDHNQDEVKAEFEVQD